MQDTVKAAAPPDISCRWQLLRQGNVGSAHSPFLWGSLVLFIGCKLQLVDLILGDWACWRFFMGPYVKIGVFQIKDLGLIFALSFCFRSLGSLQHRHPL